MRRIIDYHLDEVIVWHGGDARPRVAGFEDGQKREALHAPISRIDPIAQTAGRCKGDAALLQACVPDKSVACAAEAVLLAFGVRWQCNEQLDGIPRPAACGSAENRAVLDTPLSARHVKLRIGHVQPREDI